jgi:hypothetical protein
MKPPPRAPPPAALLQSQQRPPVDAVNKKVDDNGTIESQPKSSNPTTFTAPMKAGGISMFEQNEESSSKMQKPINSVIPSEKADSKSELMASIKAIPMPRGPPPTSAPPSSRETPLIATVSRSSKPPPPLSLSAGIPVIIIKLN